MLNIIPSVVLENPYWFIALIILLFLVVIGILKESMFEHIKCKVLLKKSEKTIFRYTTVRRHKKKNFYQLHSLNGRWVDLNPTQLEKVIKAHANNKMPVFHIDD